jgi:hypothetical protein
MSERQTDTTCLWQKHWQSDRRSYVAMGWEGRWGDDPGGAGRQAGMGGQAGMGRQMGGEADGRQGR